MKDYLGFNLIKEGGYLVLKGGIIENTGAVIDCAENDQDDLRHCCLICHLQLQIN